MSITTNYEPPVDTAAPRIVLRGTGKLAMLPTGEPVMLDTVAFGSIWADPGADAFDPNAYGLEENITSSLSTFGVASVDTGVVTAPDKVYSYVVTYQVGGCEICWDIVVILASSCRLYCQLFELDYCNCRSLTVLAIRRSLQGGSSRSFVPSPRSSALTSTLVHSCAQLAGCAWSRQ